MRALLIAAVAAIAAIAALAAPALVTAQPNKPAKPDCGSGNDLDSNGKKICKIIGKLYTELYDKDAPDPTQAEWTGIVGVTVEFDENLIEIEFSDPAIMPTNTCKDRNKAWISSYPISTSTAFAFCDDGPMGSLPTKNNLVHLDTLTMIAGRYVPTAKGNVSCDATFVPKAVKDHATCKP